MPASARGEKIALIGRNGAGKTTLLRSLLRNAPGVDEEKDFPVDSGTVTGVTKSRSAISRRTISKPSICRRRRSTGCIRSILRPPSKRLRGLLGQMLFSGDDALKPTKALSGGEAARLTFCRLMLQKPNFLVLDEPTNHLDLESINALNIALQKYEGTVLLVTHDHDLIDEVATRIWHFDHGSIEDFKGPYEEYLSHTEQKVS